MVGWILISTALPRVQVSLAGLIILLQPSLAFIWDILFFARPTGLAEMLGACLALAAIYLGVTRQKAG
jgi:drug/metabolite transporter (DMT)-like permease